MHSLRISQVKGRGVSPTKEMQYEKNFTFFHCLFNHCILCTAAEDAFPSYRRQYFGDQEVHRELCGLLAHGSGVLRQFSFALDQDHTVQRLWPVVGLWKGLQIHTGRKNLHQKDVFSAQCKW